MPSRTLSARQLVNGSVGDPVLYLDYPGSHNAILFDAGENGLLTMKQLTDLEAVFITHHHVDHFVGLDRIIRANLDSTKTLVIVGPIHSIARIYDRVKSYDYPFFPFMQLQLEIRELHDGYQRIGRFGCSTKFAPPIVEDVPWKGLVCYDTEFLTVEAVPVVHTVPCWAYAMVESGGWHPDPDKLSRGILKHGAWVGETLRLLRSRADEQTKLEIEGGQYTLAKLAEIAFTQTTGARIAYITDTLMTDELRPHLVKLAKGASYLYCDSFYAKAQTKDAAKYKHMMAHQAAELAKSAKVDQLVLIHHATRYAGRYELLLEEASAIVPRVSHQI
jgi:ribonuclease Z